MAILPLATALPRAVAGSVDTEKPRVFAELDECTTITLFRLGYASAYLAAAHLSVRRRSRHPLPLVESASPAASTPSAS